MKRDRLYLLDILQCISRIEDYTIEGREPFFQTRMIQDAVVRNFEIIGEASKRLSQDFKQENSDLPWRKIAGFRDVLIHDYVHVDSNEVWGVVEQNLPDLKRRIEEILQSFDS